MNAIVRAFCIGHVRPVFEPTLPFTMLCPKALGLPGEVVLPDHRFGPGIQGAVLAEYSQLFGLQDLLEAGDIVADRLYLFQYRKFIGFRAGGQAATAPWLRIAPPDQARTLMPTLEELQGTPHAVVVGSMYPLGGSVATNYALVHVIDDLVAFAGCLHACGMGAAEVRRFASFQGLLPSPSLCLVDTALFLRQMRVLRSAWNEYAAHAHVAREGYQMRVAGYLLERLHSHLLCQWLLDGSQNGVGLGHRFVVLDPALPAKAPSLVESTAVEAA
jgi:hypothetical protein